MTSNYAFIVLTTLLTACSSSRPSPPQVETILIERSTVRVTEINCDLDNASKTILASAEGVLGGNSESRVTFAREVAIDVPSFSIDKRHIDCAQRRACIAAGACRSEGNECRSDKGHVWRISYREAEDLCRWRGGRLPTYTEWQRAVRGKESRASAFPENFERTRKRCEPHGRSVERFYDTCEITSSEGVITNTGPGGEWVAEISCQGDKATTLRVNTDSELLDAFYLRTADRDGPEFMQARCVMP